MTFDREPDLDNANVGIPEQKGKTESCQLGGFPFYFIGKTASGALLNEKGPRGGGHENGTVVKLEDIKTFCSPIVIIVIEFM